MSRIIHLPHVVINFICFTPWNPPDSIMGAYYGPDGCNSDLGQDDANGLAQLYGQRYLLPAVYSNYNGWSSVITVMEENPGNPYNTCVFLRFDPGTTYNPAANFPGGSGEVYLGQTANPNQPFIFDAAQGLPQGQYDAAGIDSDGGSSAAIVNWIGTQSGTNDVFFTYPGGIR